MSDKALSRVVPAPDGDPISVAVSKPGGPGDEAPDPDDDAEDDDSGSKDILQFTTSIYFVEVEKEDTLTVDVMRLGKMEDTIKVKYYTEDGSAKAGVSYAHTEGELVFPPGEYRQSIEIEVVKNPRWAPTLEYKVQLSDPEGCNLGMYLKTARVKCIDTKPFPTAQYKPSPNPGSVKGKLRLLREYYKLCFQVPGTKWRTFLTLFIDQFKNGYNVAKLLLNVYIVDVLFNTADPTTQDALLLPDRAGTAVLVGLFYVLPMVAIHIGGIVKVQMDLPGQLRLFLQCCLFRKYLNYSEESRASVVPSDMQTAITNDAGSCAAAYAKLLDLIAVCLELIVFTYFTLDRNPAAIVYIVAMPACMVVYVAFVKSLCRKDVDAFKAQNKLVLRIVAEVCERYRLVADYFQRPQMNEGFATSASSLRQKQSRKALANLNDDMFPQWLGPGFTALYISFDANNVLNGQVTLGTFLATISILGSISGQFARAYGVILDILELAAPVQKLTGFYNKPTDLMTWKGVNRQRRENTKAARKALLEKEAAGGPPVLYKTDLIEMRLQGVCYANPAKTLFSKVDVTIPQGKLVAVNGSHGSGKATLMRLLAHIIFPQDGCIFVPSHLRILHLAQEPMLLNASAWVNLVFGVGDRPVVPKRIRTILEMMGMQATLKLIEEDLDRVTREGRRAAGDTWNRPPDNKWMDGITYTEKVKINLARAMIMNPEVMVAQRPLHHYDAKTAVQMTKLLRAHVEERGLVLPEDQRIHRRPRTCFFTLENAEQANDADMTLHIQEDCSVRMDSRDKPTEDTPAADKPAEDKPAEEKPAEEKPQEDKPAEEKPPEEKPAEEDLPMEEKPAE